MPPPPTGLYLHVPFCRGRCRYCAFSSQDYDTETALAYLDALERESAERTEELRPCTVFLGGGTPTCLPLPMLERLLDIVLQIDLDRMTEFTVEANPGTLTMDKLMLLRDAGATRISLGVQTFQERGLSLLGRRHTAKQARTAVALAREAGFDEISLDLIFGWPSQWPGEWRADLEKALRLGVEHLSCYGLTMEPGTPLEAAIRRGALPAPKEEEQLLLFNMTGEILGARGRPRYEISNFAAPGHECRHNLTYWTAGRYVGLGAAAHSFVRDERFANADDVEDYIARVQETGGAVVERDRLPPERRGRECAVVWLRLANGIERRLFRRRTGFDLEKLLGGTLHPLLAGGWLVWEDEGERLRLTAKALPVADSILADLVA